MSYWGQPAHRDETGTLTRWKVRKHRSLPMWSVHMPDGSWSGDFSTFREALRWATDPFARMTYWMENQT